jgi:hypothetical protein
MKKTTNVSCAVSPVNGEGCIKKVIKQTHLVIQRRWQPGFSKALFSKQSHSVAA